MKLIIGVDEVGRGPLAGPVTVGIFVAKENLKIKLLKILGGPTSQKLRGASKVKDSKQLSEKRSGEIFGIFKEMKLAGEIDFDIAHSSPKSIDKKGISWAVQEGIEKCFKKITPLAPLTLRGERNQNIKPIIRLDGLLKAPDKFKSAGWRTKTIIGGDAKDVFIACASIVAKVSRDHLMKKLAKKYPEYGFETHKGYGTRLHRERIRAFGLSAIHRATFCANITQK